MSHAMSHVSHAALNTGPNPQEWAPIGDTRATRRAAARSRLRGAGVWTGPSRQNELRRGTMLRRFFFLLFRL